MLGQLSKQAEEQILETEKGSRRASEEIPIEFLWSPQDLIQSSLSMYSRTSSSFIMSTCTGEVLHCRNCSDDADDDAYDVVVVSSKHRFPEDEIANEQNSTGSSSQTIFAPA